MAFWQFLLQILQFYQYYLIVAVLVFLAIARVFKGLFNAYMEVKISRGKKILLNVKGLSGKHFFLAGKIIEDFLVFKFNKRDKITVNIPLPDKRTGEAPVIYTFGTLECINIDERTATIIKPGLEPTERNDYNKIDSLLTRALYRPSKDDTLLKVILVLGIISTLGVLLALFLIYKDHKIILALYDMVAQIPTTTQPLVIGG